MPDETENDFLVPAEAAKVMRMAKRTLDNHRCKGTGPKFRRHGGRIVYRRCDLLEWSEERAARTAGKQASYTPSRPLVSRNGRHPPGSGKGQHSNTAVECQPERSNRPLHGDTAGAGKRQFGSRQPDRSGEGAG
jgi:hypothetical protein